MEHDTQNLALEVAELCYSASDHEILCDVSFSVQKGQYLVIIGPNGAGKTTLLKCLMRIYKKNKGSIQILGKKLGELSQKNLAKLVGYVPQVNGMALGFTVYEIVAMGRYPYLNPFSGLSSDDKIKVERALELTNTVDLRDRTAGTLSGGERQRVSIAAALAQEAKILLLDEPTSFLDPLHQLHVHELLAELHQNLELTIVAVTHDINAAAVWGERIMALKNGRTVFSGTGEDLMKNEVLENIYDKRFIIDIHPDTGRQIVLPDAKVS